MIYIHLLYILTYLLIFYARREFMGIPLAGGAGTQQFVYRGSLVGNRVVGGTVFRCRDAGGNVYGDNDQDKDVVFDETNGSRGFLVKVGTFLLVKNSVS